MADEFTAAQDTVNGARPQPHARSENAGRALKMSTLSVLRLHRLPEKSEPRHKRPTRTCIVARGEAPFGLRDRFCEADAGARGAGELPGALRRLGLDPASPGLPNAAREGADSIGQQCRRPRALRSGSNGALGETAGACRSQLQKR
ncbi:hypothetical protein MTO96_013219 [Rhipicephalus appendiculatus]